MNMNYSIACMIAGVLLTFTAYTTPGTQLVDAFFGGFFLTSGVVWFLVNLFKVSGGVKL